MDLLLVVTVLLAAIGTVMYWKLARGRPSGGHCAACGQEMIYITDLPTVVIKANGPRRRVSLLDDRSVALFGCTRCGTRKSVTY
jgi:hypothetical protein